MALVPGDPIPVAGDGTYLIPYPKTGGLWTQVKIENATAYGLTLYYDGSPVHTIPGWVTDVFSLSVGPSGPGAPPRSPLTMPAPQLTVSTSYDPVSGEVPGTIRPSFAQYGDAFPGTYPLSLPAPQVFAGTSPQIGQLVSDSFGPFANTDAVGTETVTLISFTLPMVAGQNYLITARYQGIVEVAVPNWVNVQINDSAGLIEPGQAFVCSENAPALVVGNVVCGGISTEIKASTSTGNVIVMVINTNGGPTATVRTLARNAEIVVVRIN